MRKLLIAVDMQNDFIDGTLGTKEAVAVVDKAIEQIKRYPSKDIFATRDTHPKNYMETQEGKNLPVEHCIKDTYGWQINEKVAAVLGEDVPIIDKPTFGSMKLAELIIDISRKEEIEVILLGFCTDVCVVSNALLLKACMPEVKISVLADCCAGVTPESHKAALTTMKMCQINVIDNDSLQNITN